MSLEEGLEGVEDKALAEKVLKLRASVDKITVLLEKLESADLYSKLDTHHKVDYDLFVAFCLNTLYWIYLRTKGLDPNLNEVKNELLRIRGYMKKAKMAQERSTLRPRLNIGVAKRFVKYGTWNPKDKQPGQPPNKIRKIS